MEAAQPQRRPNDHATEAPTPRAAGVPPVGDRPSNERVAEIAHAVITDNRELLNRLGR